MVLAKQAVNRSPFATMPTARETTQKTPYSRRCEMRDGINGMREPKPRVTQEQADFFGACWWFPLKTIVVITPMLKIVVRVVFVVHSTSHIPRQPHERDRDHGDYDAERDGEGPRHGASVVSGCAHDFDSCIARIANAMLATSSSSN